MKRIVFCSSVALLLAGIAAISAGAGGSYNSVTGAGWRGSPSDPTVAIRHFEVSAHDGPNGVTGQFSEDQKSFPLANFRGDVKCLVVTGNQAIVGGVITSSDDPTNVGTGFAIGFIDNASPTPDMVTLTDTGEPPILTAADCAAESFLFTDVPVLPFVRGNVVVHGA